MHCIVCRNLRDHGSRCCTCQSQRNIDQCHIISILRIQSLDHIFGSTFDIHDSGIHVAVDISVYIIDKSTEDDRHDNEHDIAHYMTHALIYGMMVIGDPFADDLAVHSIDDQHKDQRRCHTCTGTHGSTCSTPSVYQIHISCCGKMLNKYMGHQKCKGCHKYLLNDLRDRCRHHIAVCLEISAKNTTDT